MKTKREVLEVTAKNGHCIGISCDDCPYESRGCYRIRKIGAMAILRMFKKRKKPVLSVGTKIKFDNGKLYSIEKRVNSYNREEYCLRSKDTLVCYSIDCLIGRTWEVVE